MRVLKRQRHRRRKATELARLLAAIDAVAETRRPQRSRRVARASLGRS
jgi:hypothetical protein